MANTNQGKRSGNVFGTLSGQGNAAWAYDVALKPGYLCKIRDRFVLVESVESVTVDLFFTDTHSVTVSSSQITDANLVRYGQNSITAAMFPDGSPATGSTTSTVLSPNFDSGYLKFDDLEPFFGHLYQLCPTMPTQPKFIEPSTGDWLVSAGATDPGLPPSDEDADQSTPIGFDTIGGAGYNSAPVGSVSAKLYLKHPSGVPKWVLDEAPEAESGSIGDGNLLGLSGFIDGQISSGDNPNWSYSIWIEHGENNLPTFRLVNDSEEYLVDGRVRLMGWKYRVVELSMDQLAEIKSRSGGRLTFKIINPAGIPTTGSLLAEYFPK